MGLIKAADGEAELWGGAVYGTFEMAGAVRGFKFDWVATEAKRTFIRVAVGPMALVIFYVL